MNLFYSIEGECSNRMRTTNRKSATNIGKEIEVLAALEYLLNEKATNSSLVRCIRVFIGSYSIRTAIFGPDANVLSCRNGPLNRLEENDSSKCTIFDSVYFNWMTSAAASGESPCLNGIEERYHLCERTAQQCTGSDGTMNNIQVVAWAKSILGFENYINNDISNVVSVERCINFCKGNK